MLDVFLPHRFPPTYPLRLFARFLREPEFSVGMQKFGLILIAVSTALLGLVAPVEGVALVETNAERFARGLPPLPPRAAPPNPREGAPRIVFFSFLFSSQKKYGG